VGGGEEAFMASKASPPKKLVWCTSVVGGRSISGRPSLR
jgi:hypothetical protein